MKRTITLVVTADTDGNKTKRYFKEMRDGETLVERKEIEYMDITSDEKHKLLQTMGLID